MAAAREGGGADPATTVSRQRLDPHNSGYARSLARLAVTSAAPTVPPANPAGKPGSRQGRNERCVDCESRPSPQWQAFGNDLNAPVVLPDWVDVEVADKHIVRATAAPASRHILAGRRKDHGLRGTGIWHRPTATAAGVCGAV